MTVKLGELPSDADEHAAILINSVHEGEREGISLN
jgi:hypothetical protein